MRRCRRFARQRDEIAQAPQLEHRHRLGEGNQQAVVVGAVAVAVKARERLGRVQCRRSAVDVELLVRGTDGTFAVGLLARIRTLPCPEGEIAAEVAGTPR